MTATADPADALRGANRSTGERRAWTQKSLVVAQAALSLILLCAAGLLTQSLLNMQNQRYGFETANRYISHIGLSLAGYKAPQLPALYRQLHDAVAAIPGVTQVSFSMYSPMEGDNWGETLYIEGQAPPPPDSDQNQASWVRVTDGYFDAIGTKIVEGRPITTGDTASTQRVAVVNQIFAKKFFKNESAIGHHFGNLDMKYAGNFEIVGVTEDTQYRQPTQKIPAMFFLASDQSSNYEDPRFVAFENANHYLNAMEIKTMGNVPELEPQVRRALAQVNPDLPLIDFTSFAEQVNMNFSQQAMIAKLTSMFGFLALILASVGLYGGTTDERDWHSHGTGSGSSERVEAGSARSVSPGRNRAGHRYPCNHPWRSCHGGATLWSESLRPQDSAADDRDAQLCSFCCGGAARPQSGIRRADSRSAN